MNDLISRQAAIEAVENAKTAQTPDGEIYVAKFNAEMNIQILPSAEPEVIRCKHCKWFGEIGCAIRIVDDSDKPKEDDFCSFAERRED